MPSSYPLVRISGRLWCQSHVAPNRFSGFAKYSYTWHFRVKFAPGRPQNWVFYLSFPDESRLDSLGRNAESIWLVRRGLSGRLVIGRSGSILRGPRRRRPHTAWPAHTRTTIPGPGTVRAADRLGGSPGSRRRWRP